MYFPYMPSFFNILEKHIARHLKKEQIIKEVYLIYSTYEEIRDYEVKKKARENLTFYMNIKIIVDTIHLLHLGRLQ